MPHIITKHSSHTKATTKTPHMQHKRETLKTLLTTITAILYTQGCLPTNNSETIDDEPQTQNKNNIPIDIPKDSLNQNTPDMNTLDTPDIIDKDENTNSNPNINSTPDKMDNHFVITVQTNITNNNNPASFTIPIGQGSFNYDVDWNNDGVFEETNLTNSATHTYNQHGNYTIRIRGKFPHINFSNSSESAKLIEIQQWGAIEWESMEGSFAGCKNLKILAQDDPNLSLTESTKQMFQNASSVNPTNIGNWNTSNIKNMAHMFQNAISFNQDIGNWDVSNVVDMTSMFQGSRIFNQDLRNWDTSKVETVENMFSGAVTFNRPLANFSLDSMQNLTGVLDNSGLSRTAYDATLLTWERDGVPPDLTLGAEGVTYCNANMARTALIENYGWTINDAGDDCP